MLLNKIRFLVFVSRNYNVVLTAKWYLLLYPVYYYYLLYLKNALTLQIPAHT